MTAAALANGVAVTALVREDMHAGSVSHLGVVVLPTLLALSQRGAVTGCDFIAAGIVGYEAGAKIGRAIITPDFAKFFRPTGFTGPIAGAAAGSRLLGLNEDACTSAIALAANTASGLNQWPHEGADDMFFHPGFRRAKRRYRRAAGRAWRRRIRRCARRTGGNADRLSRR